MKAMIDFFRTMLNLPKPWVAWVMLLMTANMIIPLFYLRGEREPHLGKEN